MENPKTDYTGDIQIVHLSDLHFGSHNICIPEDATGSRAGIPSLGQLISKDLNDHGEDEFNDNTDYAEHLPPPVIVAVTGDFTQTASRREFRQAAEFLSEITSKPILGQPLTAEDVFMIPGNHDVTFTSEDLTERFQQYSTFYNEFYEGARSAALAHDARSLTQVHTIEKEGSKVLVTEINCSMYVERDTVDQSRGQVDLASISKLRKELTILKAKPRFEEYIKVAMIHHHVILVPSFIEPGRGVDSVVYARELLELLNEFDFHVILHGHKHYPQVFSYDPITPWSESHDSLPQVIIAGGSCGSNELPQGPTNSCNTYSVINIKWHPKARQARVRIRTRGLVRRKSTGDLTPDQWSWKTVSTIDKTIAPYQKLPSVGQAEVQDLSDNSRRQAVYEDVRYRLPVVEVLPSLLPGQAYEARAWIVEHKPEENKSNPRLIKVEWSAGRKFKNQICLVEENPNFCISYQYWGPMLIEAKMTFDDEHTAYAYVYARLPKEEI
jgi:3',5'-cyclic AMP phosphodiesterase CpdA